MISSSEHDSSLWVWLIVTLVGVAAFGFGVYFVERSKKNGQVAGIQKSFWSAIFDLYWWWYPIPVAGLLVLGWYFSPELGRGHDSSTGATHATAESFKDKLSRAKTDADLVMLEPEIQGSFQEGLSWPEPKCGYKGSEAAAYVSAATSGPNPETRKVLASVFQRMVATPSSSKVVKAGCLMAFLYDYGVLTGEDPVATIKFRVFASFPPDLVSAFDPEKDVDRLVANAKEAWDTAAAVFKQYAIIQGFMVAELGDHVYEVSFGGNQRAILKTHAHSFSSKGYFTMYTKIQGTDHVKLKDDAGGFNAEWPVYEEVAEEDFNTLAKQAEEGGQMYRKLLKQAKTAKTGMDRLSDGILAVVVGGGARGLASQGSGAK